LKQIRAKIAVNDYHQAFGLLFDVLTDLLGLAKHPGNIDAESSEAGKCLFAAISAMSQHCAEGMRLCIPIEERVPDDKLPQSLCWIILKLLEEIEHNTFSINNPLQKDVRITVTQISETKINAIKDFLAEQEDLLYATGLQSVHPIDWQS